MQRPPPYSSLFPYTTLFRSEAELQAAIDRGAIQILDEATIAAMKAKWEQVRAREAAERQQEALDNGATDWQQAMEEWHQWENETQGKTAE